MGYNTPRTLQVCGLPAPWILPMPAPIVRGHLGRDDTIGVRVGDTFVQRLPANPVTGAPIESPMALLERAAVECGTQLPFVYVY